MWISGLLEGIYRGCYELYLETQASSGQTAADFYLEADYQGQSDEKASYVENMQDQVNTILADINFEFEALRSQIDYCIWQEENEVIKNTNKPLEKLFTGISSGTEEDLQEYYNAYFLMEFDENGRLTVDPVYTGGTDASILIKTLGQQERTENIVWGSLAAEYREVGISSTLKHPSNFTIAFGIPANSDYQLTAADDIENAGYWEILSAYRDAGAGLLYAGALALIAGLVLVMTSGKIWKCECRSAPSGALVCAGGCRYRYLCESFDGGDIHPVYLQPDRERYSGAWQPSGERHGRSAGTFGSICHWA